MSSPLVAEKRLDVRWQDHAPDAAAMGLLRIMNRLWKEAGIQVCGKPVDACTYVVEPLGLGASLVEIVPQSVTLGELKRNFIKGDVAQRVADHLAYDERRLAQLAASTAALLASNYLLGVVAGDGEHLMLTSEGVIFGTDFSHMFGHPTCGMSCPAVWLPRAVTVALGSWWPDVVEAAISAFQVARAIFSPAPPSQRERFTVWFLVQAALLRVESLLSLPVEHYSSSLTEEEFAAALQVVDCSLGKKVSTFLNDAFGIRSRRRSTGSVQLTRWTVPNINRFPHGFEIIPVDIDGVIWAAEANPKRWRLALCVLGCLCQDQEAGVRLLESLLWDHAVLASRSSSVVFRLGILEVVIGMVRHRDNFVQAWLSKTVRSASHFENLRQLACRFREHTAGLLSPACVAGAIASTDCLALKLGALCAFAHLDPPGDARCASEVSSHRDLLPMAVREGQVVRRGAIRLIVSMMKSEDLDLRRLLEELAVHMPGGDLAAAARDLREEERFSAVRAVEAFAKDVIVGTRLCSWARAWLTAMAQDQDPDLSRTSVCSIACAVDDEDAEVQKWARDFLTAAAWDKDKPRQGTPVFAFARMAQVGGPHGPLEPAEDEWSLDDPPTASVGSRAAVVWEHGPTAMATAGRPALGRGATCGGCFGRNGSGRDSGFLRIHATPVTWPLADVETAEHSASSEDPFIEGYSTSQRIGWQLPKDCIVHKSAVDRSKHDIVGFSHSQRTKQQTTEVSGAWLASDESR